MSGEQRAAAHERQMHHAMGTALRMGLLVWVAMLVLLGAALASAYAPLGAWRLPATLGAAVLQAALVFAFFMDLRRARALTLLTVAASLLFAALMFALTFNDLFHRI